jgi:hypothetical protein
MPPSRSVDVWTGSEYNGTVSEATVFLSHLYVKTIFLPRQARDKHRENSKNEYRFLSGGAYLSCSCLAGQLLSLPKGCGGQCADVHAGAVRL